MLNVPAVHTLPVIDSSEKEAGKCVCEWYMISSIKQQLFKLNSLDTDTEFWWETLNVNINICLFATKLHGELYVFSLNSLFSWFHLFCWYFVCTQPSFSLLIRTLRCCSSNEIHVNITAWMKRKIRDRLTTTDRKRAKQWRGTRRGGGGKEEEGEEMKEKQ